VEPLDDFAGIDAVKEARENRSDGRTNQIAGDLFGAAQLALVLELELACDRRQRSVKVTHPRHRHLFAVLKRTAFGVRGDELERRNRQSLTDARSLVDLTIGSCLKRDFFDDLTHVAGDVDLHARPFGPGFLRGDRDGTGPRERIVSPDLRTDTILERR